ncbi:MAG: gfo/Idh/MocA family oxidoreductase [Verrucomicrobiaceae bacterium]|nr:MAG: gfo/Idh/MocA family oxidoreductase [Verrucomicrobiaceae bacterium]
MNNLSRRNFLKRSTLLGAGAFMLPRFSIAQAGVSANSKLNLALIGVGGGGIVKGAIMGAKGENLVAICDVDESQFGKFADVNPQIATAARFRDFRVMLDKMGKEIDAVVITIPDHTHFAATMDAMQRGKHVLTQKPLTHNIWQARTLRKAKQKYKVVTNMGNQGHSMKGIREMREWVDAGVLGTVSEVDSYVMVPKWGGGVWKKSDSYPPAAMPVPPSLDWNLWLGPVADPGYNSVYAPGSWRGYDQFGTGAIGDFFCHLCDGPVWTLDLYDPLVVEAEKIVGPNPGMCPDASIIRWDFAARGDMPPCSLRWYDGGLKPATPEKWSWGEVPDRGSFFRGSKNTVYLDNVSSNPRLASKEEMQAFKEAGLPPQKYPRVEGGPMAEWIRAIKGEGPEPGSNFDYSSRLTEIACLGALAQRFGGRIEWDSKNLRSPNRPELDPYIKEPARKGWEYGEDLWKV